MLLPMLPPTLPPMLLAMLLAMLLPRPIGAREIKGETPRVRYRLYVRCGGMPLIRRARGQVAEQEERRARAALPAQMQGP
eukprot:3156766-Rhodomonas_salina.1